MTIFFQHGSRADFKDSVKYASRCEVYFKSLMSENLQTVVGEIIFSTQIGQFIRNCYFFAVVKLSNLIFSTII